MCIGRCFRFFFSIFIPLLALVFTSSWKHFFFLVFPPLSFDARGSTETERATGEFFFCDPRSTDVTSRNREIILHFFFLKRPYFSPIPTGESLWPESRSLFCPHRKERLNFCQTRYICHGLPSVHRYIDIGERISKSPRGRTSVDSHQSHWRRKCSEARSLSNLLFFYSVILQPCTFEPALKIYLRCGPSRVQSNATVKKKISSTFHRKKNHWINSSLSCSKTLGDF